MPVPQRCPGMSDRHSWRDEMHMIWCDPFAIEMHDRGDDRCASDKGGYEGCLINSVLQHGHARVDRRRRASHGAADPVSWAFVHRRIQLTDEVTSPGSTNVFTASCVVASGSSRVSSLIRCREHSMTS